MGREPDHIDQVTDEVLQAITEFKQQLEAKGITGLRLKLGYGGQQIEKRRKKGDGFTEVGLKRRNLEIDFRINEVQP